MLQQRRKRLDCFHGHSQHLTIGNEGFQLNHLSGRSNHCLTFSGLAENMSDWYSASNALVQFPFEENYLSAKTYSSVSAHREGSVLEQQRLDPIG